MEESIKQLWTVCLWFFGLSSTVTVGLFGWLISLSNRIAIKEDMRKDFEEIMKDLKEIKTKLFGEYDKKGLVNALHDRVERLEEKIGGT